MARRASRRGAVDIGTILMVIATVVVVGYLFWLVRRATAERAARNAPIAEDTTAAPDELAAAAPVVPSDIQPDASSYLGRLVRIMGMEVAGTLGRQGFWLALPSSPFLVAFSEGMLADSARVEVGSRVSVTGTIRAMSDSVAASWLAAGRIGEGDQVAASFSTHFLEALRIQPASGGTGGGR